MLNCNFIHLHINKSDSVRMESKCTYLRNNRIVNNKKKGTRQKKKKLHAILIYINYNINYLFILIFFIISYYFYIRTYNTKHQIAKIVREEY